VGPHDKPNYVYQAVIINLRRWPIQQRASWSQHRSCQLDWRRWLEQFFAEVDGFLFRPGLTLGSLALLMLQHLGG
jgi:hypothetical protein